MAKRQGANELFGFRQGAINARRYAVQQARMRDNLSRGFQKRVETSFNKTVNIVAKQVEDGEDVDGSLLVRDVEVEVTAVIRAQLNRVFKTIYDYNYQAYQVISAKADEGDAFFFGRSLAFEQAVALYFVNRDSFITSISRTQGLLILASIERLRLGDGTLAQIAIDLKKTFRPINRGRAALIARTETHSAAGFAHQSYHKEVSDSYGVAMVKQWVATGDGRTRLSHSSANGQQVSMDEDFIIGGRPMAYSGDPRGGAINVCNCRCVVIYTDTRDDVQDDFDPDDYEDI